MGKSICVSMGPRCIVQLLQGRLRRLLRTLSVLEAGIVRKQTCIVVMGEPLKGLQLLVIKRTVERVSLVRIGPQIEGPAPLFL